MKTRTAFRTVLAGALLGLGVGVAVTAGPASAEGTDCDSVTVANRTSDDSGENGNTWATTTLDRTIEVCVIKTSDTGDWKYLATVKDSGTFETKAGESPGKDLVTIVAGFKGAVVGGFKATFEAPKWNDDTLKTPDKETSTGKWVETVFPGAKFTEAGSVAEWGWTYTTCGSNGEKWVNAEAGNSGDITKACVAPTTEPTVQPTPSPSHFPCEAYVYTGTKQNLCAAFPGQVSAVDCKDVKYRVTLVDVKVDPWGLDANGAGTPGVGCEANPVKAPGSPTPSHSATASQSTSAAGLPVTGDSLPKVGLALGAVLVAVGLGAIVVGRRRRATFEA